MEGQCISPKCELGESDENEETLLLHYKGPSDVESGDDNNHKTKHFETPTIQHSCLENTNKGSDDEESWSLLYEASSGDESCKEASTETIHNEMDCHFRLDGNEFLAGTVDKTKTNSPKFEIASNINMDELLISEIIARKRVAVIRLQRCDASVSEKGSEGVVKRKKIVRKKAYFQIPVKCPICEKSILNISRHLRKIHCVKDTRYWRCIYDCKKKGKHARPLKDCPVINCMASVQRLDHHMKCVHPNYKHKHSNILQRYGLTGRRKLTGNDRTYKIEVEGFKTWLQSPDGGCKNNVSARQCASQLVAVFTLSGLGPHDLFIDQDRLRNTFWETICKKRRPGTVISYLGTLQLYIRYKKMYEKDQEKCQLLDALNARMRHWAISIRRERAERKWEVRQRDTREKLEPEDIRAIESSTFVEKARSIIANSASKDEVSRKDFTFVRNILMTLVLVQNAQRSGTLRNMTMGEYRSSVEETAYNRVTVVKDVKTLGAQGPARIVFTGASKELMTGYVRNIRSKIPNSDDDDAYVFSTYKGKRLWSSGIPYVMNNLAKKCGLKKKFTPTSLRKSVVTLVHENMPDKKEQLARHMGHSVSTAVSYYRLQENISKSCETVHMIKTVLDNNTKHNTVEEVVGEAKEENEQDEVVQINDTQMNDTLKYKNAETVPDCEKKQTKKNRWNQCFTQKETELVKQNFSIFINTKHMPSLADVRRIRESLDRTDTDLLSAKSDIQIRDKVRTLYRCKHV